MAFLNSLHTRSPNYWSLLKWVALIFLVPLLTLAIVPIIITALAQLPVPEDLISKVRGPVWLVFVGVGFASGIWFLLQSIKYYKELTQKLQQKRARVREAQEILKRRYFLLSVSVLLLGLFVVALLPIGISYIWHLLALPARDQNEEMAFLRDLNKIIEHTNSEIAKTNQVRNVEQQYSDGVVIVYVNAGNMLIYNTENSGIALSNLRIKQAPNNEICIFGTISVYKKELSINNFPLDVCLKTTGSPIYLAKFADIGIFVEAVAREGKKVAWIIGLKPV